MIKEVKKGNKVVGYEFSYVLTPEEYKAFTVIAVSPDEWIKNAISNRVRQAIDELVIESGLGNKKTEKERKYAIIRTLVVKTLKERHDEEMKDIKAVIR